MMSFSLYYGECSRVFMTQAFEKNLGQNNCFDFIDFVDFVALIPL